MSDVILYDQFNRALPTARQRALATAQARSTIRARWDAVQTTTDNERHWANADGLSARSAASPEVRRKFRNRSRYEVCNNSYAQGIVLTLANHTIGTGPRLQVLTKDEQTNRQIEFEFAKWARKIKLAQKLRTMRMVRAVDGESFAVFVTNNRIRGPVKLDVQLFEGECFATPDLRPGASNAVDGIVFDDDGNPVTYHKLKEHPGNTYITGKLYKYDELPADSVIHLFREDRPGQVRGIPEIAAALPLFAQLRRFTLATIAAAETAADYAAILYSEAPGGADDFEATDGWDTIPIEQRMFTTVPYGYKLDQLKAEHPTTTYEMFKRSLLQEIARCINMPYNIAAGDSSSYNYSSGRLDHQTYFNAIDIDQASIEEEAVERILFAWLDEAVLIPGLLPEKVGLLEDLPHQWYWDEIEDIDPEKTAKADEIRIRIGTVSRARAYARQGLDVNEEDRRSAESLNCTVEEYRDLLRKSLFSGSSGGSGSATPSSAQDTNSTDQQEEGSQTDEPVSADA